MLHLERPVLSLTIDAVVNMNGEDALCGLLTLFHKCKDGLQDGDRLENMAWRLWHVERASSQDDLPASAALASPGGVASLLTSSSSTCSDGSSEVSSDGETWDQDQATTVQEDTGASSEKDTISTLSDRTPSQGQGVPSSVRAHPLKHAASKHRSPSPTSSTSTRMPDRRPFLASRRTHSNTSIGQIMADLLPEKLDLHRSTFLKVLTEQDVDKTRPPPVPGGGDQLPAVIVMPETQLQQPQPRPSPPLSTQLDPSVRFPTVVIVNPTPHPTPPMTPQVSSPPTTSPSYSDVSNAPRRDTLSVVTDVRSPISPTLPPTPESMGEESASQQPLGSISETKISLLSYGSGPRSEANRNNGSTGRIEANGIAAEKSIATNNDTSNVLRSASRLPTGAPGLSGSTLNPPERKFFISQAGSPDCDSPDTSASSQVGSQSGISASAVALSVVDTKAVDMTAGGDPASVASRSSVLTTRSGSSNGSSARGGNGLHMKSRKAGASSNAKGKAKESRPSALQRSHSSNRIFRLQTSAGGLTGGTIQRSKLGGRTAAAATAHPGTLVPSQFARQQSSRLPPTSGVSVHPPPPAPVSKLVKAEKSKAEKSTATSSSDSRPQSATRRTSSSRRSSKSGSSTKVPKPSTSTLQNSQRRLEIADDSDYSTESEEWDTEDVSEEAERDNEKAIADRKLAEAAAEAQRQRELFAKVDRRSYSDLTRVRTQPGLLSTIFHPDPALFPPDHPYRHSRSTQDILAHVNRPAYMPAPLQPTRSAAAAPVAATVTAQGVGTPTQNHINNSRQRSPLRLKGRPKDVEESDSGEDDNNKLHISESVAEKRLAMLQRQSAKGAQKGPPKLVPGPQQPLQRPDVYPAVGQAPVGRYGLPAQGPSALARISTEPIPLGYPYNLPPPIPPSTPRTTRRNMLTNELSESLRRNLLWERQVSKQRPIGLQRRAVTNGAPPTRPMAAPSGLRATTTAPNNLNMQAQQPRNPQQNGITTKSQEEGVPQRNRSWSDDFHVTGW